MESSDLKIGVTQLIFQIVGNIPWWIDSLNKIKSGKHKNDRYWYNRTAAIPSGPLLFEFRKLLRSSMISSNVRETLYGKWEYLSIWRESKLLRVAVVGLYIVTRQNGVSGTSGTLSWLVTALLYYYAAAHPCAHSDAIPAERV